MTYQLVEKKKSTHTVLLTCWLAGQQQVAANCFDYQPTHQECMPISLTN